MTLSIDNAATVSATGRWFITVATVAYGLGPFVMDMNRSHLFHPRWTGHARLHLLWSAVSQLAIAALALWLLWVDASPARCVLAAVIGLCMNSGFWFAALLRKRYGGTLHDPGGIPPIAGRVDGNLIAVLLITALLVTGLWLSLP